MRPVPVCHICGKMKGQPPDRCNGHYASARPPSELKFTDEDRRFLEMGIHRNLGIRLAEAAEHLLHDYDQLMREAKERSMREETR